jgi:hypothetical protein
MGMAEVMLAISALERLPNILAKMIFAFIGRIVYGLSSAHTFPMMPSHDAV